MARQVLVRTLAVFGGVLLAGSLLAAQDDRWQRAERRRAAQEMARAVADALEQQLAGSLAAPYALAAVVREEQGVHDFDRLAAGLLELYGGIDSLQLAPGGVLTRIHPLAGNEAALGLDLLHSPIHRPDVMAAIESRRLVLAGPFPLRQGGTGLAARVAVFTHGEGGERFWGVASAILTLPRLLAASGLERLGAAGYDYELSHVRAASQQREVLAQARPAASGPRDPILVAVKVPGGAWTLAVAPRAGWGPGPRALFQYLLVVIGAVAFAALAHRLFLQPELLERQVRERTEALDRASREREALLNGLPDPAWLKDLDSRYVAVNGALARLAGVAPDAMIGKTHRDVFPDPEATEIERHDAQVLAEGREVVAEETVRVRSGVTVVYDVVKCPYRDGKGNVVGSVGIARDITARKAAERALRKSEERSRDAHLALNAIVEASPLAVLKVDRARVVTSWNAVAERIFGWTAAEAVGRPLQVVPEADLADYQATLDAAFERGVAVSGLERRRQRKDGSFVDVHISVAPVHDAAGGVREVVVYYVDVTEHRRLEEALRQSQKMEAVGQLAGGVAHDFNNLLTIINMHLQLMEEEAPAGSGLREDLEQVKAAAGRAASLTRQLLAFSRRQVLQPRVLDVAAVLDEMLKMLQRLIGEDVQLEVRTGEGLWPVRADPSQLEQVILNLAVNARDAMPGGGALAIRTRNVTLDEAFARDHQGAAAGEHVLIEVADTGTGMDEATRARAFEPFFTTKGKGKGTGLGLAMVYGIVTQSGGFVDCETAPGRGTTMRVYLPRVVEARPATPAPPCPPAAAPDGARRVLLVEDEEAVRAVMARALRAYGYAVDEAPGGAEALRLVGAGARPDLLVTDLVMPDMSGTEVVERLRARGCRPRVLLVSGYAEDELVRRGSLPAGASFMAKPFTATALAERVRLLLVEEAEAIAPVPAVEGTGGGDEAGTG